MATFKNAIFYHLTLKMKSSKLRKSFWISYYTYFISNCILHPELATKYELRSKVFVFSNYKSSILSYFIIKWRFYYTAGTSYLIMRI